MNGGNAFPPIRAAGTLYLDLKAFPRAIGVKCDAVGQGRESSAVVVGCRMIRRLKARSWNI